MVRFPVCGSDPHQHIYSNDQHVPILGILKDSVQQQILDPILRRPKNQ